MARAAGGITQDPPVGYHAIHIIVNNGNVALTGVVDSNTDADIAAIQAIPHQEFSQSITTFRSPGTGRI